MNHTKLKRFLSITDLAEQPAPRWAIEGLFEVNSLVMLAGAPATYKSFMALAWMMSISLGKPWNGRRVAQGKVLYVPGEGKSNLLKRIQTWLHYNQVSDHEIQTLNQFFRVSFDVPQLASKPSVDNMLADLRVDGFEPEVIVIDTFARSAVGIDENGSKDVGLWIEQADRLRSLGYTVIFLHHTAKNVENGVKYRGSSAILGAMDTAMIMTRSASNQITLSVTKQKDHDEGEPMTFTRLIVRLTDSPGDEGSVILMPSEAVDDRYASGGSQASSSDGLTVDEMTAQLVESAEFETDAERARELATKAGISFNTAKMRISRKIKDLESRNRKS